MSQPRWDPDERRWMLDDEHGSDAPRRRRAPITDHGPIAGIDVREPDARYARGSMTVAELTRADLDEDRHPRSGSRDHDDRGNRDAWADRWTGDVPRPAPPGRNGFRDVAEAAVDRWRDEEAGYGADRYGPSGGDTAGRDLTGRYEDARYVRDVLDGGRGSGSSHGTGRFDADVLGWGRTSDYGTDASRSDRPGPRVPDARDDRGSAGRGGGVRNGVDALDPGWRVPSHDGADRSGGAGDDGRYGTDPHRDAPYGSTRHDGARFDGTRFDGARFDGARYEDARDESDPYDDDRYDLGRYRADRNEPAPRDTARDGRDRYDQGPRGSDPYPTDRRDTGYAGYAGYGDAGYDDAGYDDAGYHGAGRRGGYEPDGHPSRNGMSHNGMSHDGMPRNGMPRTGDGRPGRNVLDVDRGEAARLDDGPYGGGYAGGPRDGAGRVDRAPYSRPPRVADGYEPEPGDEYPVRARARHDEPVDDRPRYGAGHADPAHDGRRRDGRRAVDAPGDVYEDAYSYGYEDDDGDVRDDRAYDGRDDHAGGHADDGYGPDPGARTVGVGRAARRRAREREEDGRTETRQFGLAGDEPADADPYSDFADGADGPDPADLRALDDGAEGEVGSRRKRRRRWPWVVGGVAVAGGLAVPVVLAMQDGEQSGTVSSSMVSSTGFGTQPAPVNGNPDAPAAGEVTYQLTGSGTASTVTYGRGTSISQVSGAQLPWEQKQPGVNGGSEYTLTATAAEGADEISCKISVDGAVIAEQKAEGEYAAVSCAGRR